MRMFNKRYSAYDPAMLVHEEVRFPGKAIPLQGILIHWRAYVMDEYIAVFNRYATAEAEMLNKKGRRANGLNISLADTTLFMELHRQGRRPLRHARAYSRYVTSYGRIHPLRQALGDAERDAHTSPARSHIPV